MFKMARKAIPALFKLLHVSMQTRLYHHPLGVPSISSGLSFHPTLLPSGNAVVSIVVEPSPTRSLAADWHELSLLAFQQLKRFSNAYY
jgi:hypothetical protein